jgi:ethanolaminephosphotransferase
MCIKPIEIENLENMKKFQYKTSDASLLYNKCMSPCLNKVVNIFPIWLAPNIITLFSLGCNIIAASITFFDSGFDFSNELKSSTCIIIGLTQFLYQILDNLDGKQARRTGSSSPFGMLLDHGCDIFTNCLTCFNLSHLALLGNNSFYSVTVFIGLILGFYAMTYEEYKLGELHFPIVNATDEGNVILSSFAIFCGFFGQRWLNYNIFSNFTISKLIGLFSFGGGISCVYNLFNHTCKKKGIKECLKIFLDWLYFYNVIVLPIIYSVYFTNFYELYKWSVLGCMCLLFARVTMDLQIRIVTADTIKGNYFIIFINALLLISFVFNLYRDKLYILCGVGTMLSAELLMFIIIRSNEITKYLGIKIFKINPQIQI